MPEKFQLYQNQSGRLSALFNFNMPDILQTVPVSYTITMKDMQFQIKICPEKCQLLN